MKKTILITGCSSGFGKASAQHFANNGWNVVATMRNPEVGEALEGPKLTDFVEKLLVIGGGS